jgi:hypothetical protein
MVDGKAEIEIPETWDTVKYEKPIYPTVSRGKNGSTLYNNNKYHCYGVLHIKPVHNLTPYRPTGFGFAERNMKYIPLTHVQDRSKPKPPAVVNEKSEIKKIYENSIDAVKQNCKLRRRDRLRMELDAVEIRNVERKYGNLVNKMKYEIHNLRNKTKEMIGTSRYHTHVVNRVLRDCEL